MPLPPSVSDSPMLRSSVSSLSGAAGVNRAIDNAETSALSAAVTELDNHPEVAARSGDLTAAVGESLLDEGGAQNPALSSPVRNGFLVRLAALTGHYADKSLSVNVVKELASLANDAMEHPDLSDADRAIVEKEIDSFSTLLANKFNVECSTSQELAAVVIDRAKDIAKTAREEVGALLERTLPESARAKLNIPSGEVSTKVLGQLVAAAGAGEGKLSEIDLVLVRALWLTREAEGIDFSEFQESLPARFSKIDGLERFISAGAMSCKMLNSVGETLKKVSNGLGGTKDLLQICQRMATSNDHYMADAALTTLTRNLLGGHSFSGEQAMTDGASAVCRALNKEVLEPTLFASAAKREAKLDAMQTASDTAMQEIAKQGMRKTDAARTEASIAADPNYKKHLNVLASIRNPEKIEAMKKGEAREVFGAHLATIIFVLDSVLSSDDAKSLSGGWRIAQGLIKGINLPKHHINLLDINKRTHHGGDYKESPIDTAFRECLKMLADTISGETWVIAKNQMQKVINSYKLLEKAEAVLYFKRFADNQTAANVKHEFVNVFGRPKNWTEGLSALKKQIDDRILISMGGAQKNEAARAAVKEDQQVAAKAQQKAAVDVERKMTIRMNRAVGNAVNMVICASFIDTLKRDPSASLENLLKARNEAVDVTKWGFYNDCLAKLDTMTSLDSRLRDSIKPVLFERLTALTTESFAELNENTKPDPFLYVKDILIDWSTDKEVKDLMTLDRFSRAVEGMLQKIDEDGGYITFATDSSVNIAVPILETEALNVEASIDIARENGISLQKEGDSYNLKLMRTNTVGVGVTIDGLLDSLEVEASLAGSKLNGCELQFTSAAHCRDFLAALMAGQIQKESLVLCDKMSAISGTKVDAQISLSAELDLLKVFSEETEEESNEEEEEDDSSTTVTSSVGLGGSVAWQTTINSDETKRERTVVNELSFNTSLGEDLSLERTLRFEETQKMTLNTSTHKLMELSRTRVFQIDSVETATAVLKDMGVTNAKITEICAKITDDEEFTLELDSGFNEAQIEAYNQDSIALPASAMKLLEARLVRVADSADIEHGLGGDIVSLSHTTSGEAAEVTRISF